MIASPGVSPDAIPADVGRGQQIPTPGDVKPASPGEAVCPYCLERFPLVGRTHYRVAYREETRLGACTAPARSSSASEAPKRQRTHAECAEELHRKATQGSAARVLAEARETYATHSQPEEDDSDA